MPSISLTSFLKILTKATPQKVTEYKRYLAPGGYDFYWQLKEAAHAHTVGCESFSDCLKPMLEIKRETERKHNVQAFKSLNKWMKKHSVLEFFDAPAGAWESPDKQLLIKLEPEFGATMKGQRRIIQLWNSKERLPPTLAGVGVYLLQEMLCIGEFADCKAGILNLRKCELYVYDALPPAVASMAHSELAWADAFFRDYAKAA